MGDRTYLSIGEVLSLLREEFPDITISKIRFLESQGLLDPERTPSGYRKFYEADVERLRWILQQQRENFLPLKVIKGRLDEPAPPRTVSAAAPAPQPASVAAAPAPPAEVALPNVAPVQSAPAPAAVPAAAPPAAATVVTPAPPPAASAAGTARRSPGRPAPAPTPAAAPARSAAPAGRPMTMPAPSEDLLPPGESGVDMTLDELCAAADLPIERVQELEKFGLITGRPVAGTVYYDEEAFVVARLAAGFLRFGVEARHLRIYKNAAEREAGFFEQVVMPLMRQRNPGARKQAVDTLSELARLGQGLRSAMLRQALKDYTTT